MKIFMVILGLLWMQSSFATEGTSKDSIYLLKGVWKNQDNQRKVLKDFSGAPTIVAIVYTGCAYVCPMTITKLQELESKIKGKGGRKYRVVLASFDTIKDRPERLNQYMKKRELDRAVWTMITADQDSVVRELAIVLGVNYQRLENGDFAHSNIITLLDENGVIIDHMETLNSDSTSLISKVVQFSSK